MSIDEKLEDLEMKLEISDTIKNACKFCVSFQSLIF